MASPISADQSIPDELPPAYEPNLPSLTVFPAVLHDISVPQFVEQPPPYPGLSPNINNTLSDHSTCFEGNTLPGVSLPFSFDQNTAGKPNLFKTDYKIVRFILAINCIAALCYVGITYAFVFDFVYYSRRLIACDAKYAIYKNYDSKDYKQCIEDAYSVMAPMAIPLACCILHVCFAFNLALRGEKRHSLNEATIFNVCSVVETFVLIVSLICWVLPFVVLDESAPSLTSDIDQIFNYSASTIESLQISGLVLTLFLLALHGFLACSATRTESTDYPAETEQIRNNILTTAVFKRSKRSAGQHAKSMVWLKYAHLALAIGVILTATYFQFFGRTYSLDSTLLKDRRGFSSSNKPTKGSSPPRTYSLSKKESDETIFCVAIFLFHSIMVSAALPETSYYQSFWRVQMAHSTFTLESFILVAASTFQWLGIPSPSYYMVESTLKQSAAIVLPFFMSFAALAWIVDFAGLRHFPGKNKHRTCCKKEPETFEDCEQPAVFYDGTSGQIVYSQ